VSDRGVEPLRVGEGAPSGRRARLITEQAGDRARAMTELRALAAEGASDEALCAAWWNAIRLGCTLPPGLHLMGREARTREIERRRAALPRYSGGEHDAVTPHFPQPPAPSLAQLFAVAELDQFRAFQALVTALEEDNPWRIADAAEAARRLGAFDPEIPWSRVEDAEAMVKCAGELRAALRGGDLAGAASAWFRASAIWPGALSTEDAAAGRAAFRAWGHSMRRATPNRGTC